MKIIKTLSFLLFCVFITNGLNAGSGTGGAIGAIQIENSQLESLQRAGLQDDLIRVTRPGEYLYLRANTSKIQTQRLTANVLPTGEEVTFYSVTPAELLQSSLAISLARAVKSTIPGALPIIESDLEIKLEPTIETVPLSSLDDETLQTLNIQR